MTWQGGFLSYCFAVLQALKDKGYSTYRIKNEKLLSQSTLQKLREGKPVSWENIETFCRMLEIQPGELLEYKPDTAEEDKWFSFSDSKMA